MQIARYEIPVVKDEFKHRVWIKRKSRKQVFASLSEIFHRCNPI